MLEPKIRDLALGRNFATMSFHLSDGSIASHVVWVDADDEHLLVNTEVHRTKYKALQRDPRVTVAIWNSENPYSYAEVRGTVTGEIRGQQARDNIDALALKYNGTPKYGNPIVSERVILQITPQRQRPNNL
jgi:PPOX class probable F420-dependent enzyme